MPDCHDLIRPALEESLDEYEIQSGDGNCVVVTPFEYPNGDLISLYISGRRGNLYRVRDYGETHAMLRLYGVNPGSPARENRLEHIKTRFDLDDVWNEVQLSSTAENLGPRLLDAIQAIQAVAYNTYTHKSTEPSQFNTKVETFLTDSGYDYKRGFTVEGQHQDREFDFSINHREPNVLLDTIHTNDPYNFSSQTDRVMVNWYEIQDRGYKHGVMLDDVDGIVDEDSLESIQTQLDYVFYWSDRDAMTDDIPLKV